MYEEVIEKTKAIEGYLMEMGAVGKGAHEKLDSVQHLLPEEVVRLIRRVATIRNKYVHESGYRIDREAFVYAADNVLSYFKRSSNNQSATEAPVVVEEQRSESGSTAPRSAPVPLAQGTKKPTPMPAELELTVMAAKGFWKMPLKKKALTVAAAVAAAAVAIKLNT